jgi:hypothetical protein
MLVLSYIFLLFLLRVVLRNQRAVAAGSVMIFALQNGPENLFTFAALLIAFALIFFVLSRFGLVAGAFAFFSKFLFAVIVLYAFRTLLGGCPLVSAPQLDD